MTVTSGYSLAYCMWQVACSGLAGGALACSALAVLKHPITLLLSLQPEVLCKATPYWWIRVAITPLVLLNMSISGILQVRTSLCSQSTASLGPCTSCIHSQLPEMTLRKSIQLTVAYACSM